MPAPVNPYQHDDTDKLYKYLDRYYRRKNARSRDYTVAGRRSNHYKLNTILI